MLLTHQSRVRFRAFIKFFVGKIINVAQQHWLEESGHWLENVDRTHLVLASEPELQKTRLLFFKLHLSSRDFLPKVTIFSKDETDKTCLSFFGPGPSGSGSGPDSGFGVRSPAPGRKRPILRPVYPDFRDFLPSSRISHFNNTFIRDEGIWRRGKAVFI